MSFAIQTALLRAPSCGQTRSAPSPGGGGLGWGLAVLPRCWDGDGGSLSAMNGRPTVAIKERPEQMRHPVHIVVGKPSILPIFVSAVVNLQTDLLKPLVQCEQLSSRIFQFCFCC